MYTVVNTVKATHISEYQRHKYFCLFRRRESGGLVGGLCHYAYKRALKPCHLPFNKTMEVVIIERNMKHLQSLRKLLIIHSPAPTRIESLKCHSELSGLQHASRSQHPHHALLECCLVDCSCLHILAHTLMRKPLTFSFDEFICQI